MSFRAERGIRASWVTDSSSLRSVGMTNQVEMSFRAERGIRTSWVTDSSSLRSVGMTSQDWPLTSCSLLEGAEGVVLAHGALDAVAGQLRLVVLVDLGVLVFPLDVVATFFNRGVDVLLAAHLWL